MAFRLSYKFVGVSVALALSACTPNLYVPNITNIPLPGVKNETKASGGLSTAGYYIEGSYALTDRIVIIGSYVGLFDVPDSTSPNSNNLFGAIGGGYYKTAKNARFEILGAFGIGHVWANCKIHPLINLNGNPGNKDGYNVDNNYKSGSIQADFGGFHKNVELGFSLKFNYLIMNHPYFNSYSYSGEDHREYNQLNFSLPSQAIFFEPSLFINIGLKFLKLQTRIGWSFPIGAQSEILKDLSDGSVISEGIQIDLFNESKDKKVLK